MNIKKRKMIIVLSAFLILVIGISVFMYCSNAKEHEYYCDQFIFHADQKQIDLKQVEPKITAVVELLPITKDKLCVVARINEEQNFLTVYSFKKKDFIFQTYGTMFAWIQDDYESTLYQDKDKVYDLEKQIVFEAGEGEHISVIEYVGQKFVVTITDANYENPKQKYIDISQ